MLNPKIWQNKFEELHNTKCTKKNALDITIKIWKMMQKKELDKYGLELLYKSIGNEEESFGYHESGRDCPLRKIFYNLDDGCKKCPLYKIRKNIRCDDRSELDGILVSPWFEYVESNNPKPMFSWLLKAKKKETGCKRLDHSKKGTAKK